MFSRGKKVQAADNAHHHHHLDHVDKPHVDTTRAAYTEWDDRHAKLSRKPSSDSKDYLRHAKTLVPFLEAVADFHPILKGIVVTFTTIVEFEDRRRENEGRMSVLFLAQTDLMRVFLELEQRKGTNASPGLDTWLESLLAEIDVEIRACANSLDTYYNESRVVRFLKAEEWESRLQAHADRFESYKLSVTTHLSLHIASKVGNIQDDLKSLLQYYFRPTQDWEQALYGMISERDDPDWKDNLSFLRQLTFISKDPSIDPAFFAGDLQAPSATGGSGLVSILEGIRMEVATPLSALCDTNMELFNRKLAYHNEQIKLSIRHSADHVIRSLSGPYDRVENEDLRNLWKEMKWIFCVDNTVFSVSLIEYFIDKYADILDPNHTLQNQARTEFRRSEDATPEDTDAKFQKAKAAISQSDGVAVWALNVLMQYSDKVSAAIDTDSSGFIRISEVNAFTRNMPEGWSLLQWCAFSAIGWRHELLLYQLRVHKLFLRMHELQAEVKAINRQEIVSQMVSIIRFFFPLTAGFHEDKNYQVGQEMDELVRSKMAEQDVVFRTQLDEFKYRMDGEHTIHLIFGKRPVEAYIFQLSTLLLERWVQIMELAIHYTLDVREWMWMERATKSVKTLVSSRVQEVRVQYKKLSNVDDALDKFYGGIFQIFNRHFYGADRDGSTITNMTFVSDAVSFFYESKSVDDIPLYTEKPDVTMLQYETWEDYTKHWDVNVFGSVPDTVPPAWGPPKGIAIEPSWSARQEVSFPKHTRICDVCDVLVIDQPVYHCLDCGDDDFDMCEKCYRSGVVEHEDHEPEDALVKMPLHSPQPLGYWILTLGQHHIYRIRHARRYGVKAKPMPCHRCKKEVGLDDPVRICIGHPLCRGEGLLGLRICAECVDSYTEDDPEDVHKPWHTLLFLPNSHEWKASMYPHKEKVEARMRQEEAEAPAGVVLYDSDDEKDNAVATLKKVRKLETKVEALEAKVEGELGEVKAMLQLILDKLGMNTESSAGPGS